MTTTTEHQTQLPTDAGSPASLIELYAGIIGSELPKLLDTVRAAEKRQWERAARPLGHRDERRATGGRSDPTAEVALDPVRLDLRATLNRVEPLLNELATTIVGSRRALERAVERHDGRR